MKKQMRKIALMGLAALFLAGQPSQVHAGPWSNCFAAVLGGIGSGLSNGGGLGVLAALNAIICDIPDEVIEQLRQGDQRAKDNPKYKELVNLVGPQEANKVLGINSADQSVTPNPTPTQPPSLPSAAQTPESRESDIVKAMYGPEAAQYVFYLRSLGGTQQDILSFLRTQKPLE